MAGTLGGWLIAGAGVLGACGVLLSAVAAHLGGGGSLAVAGVFCLIHAAVVVALACGRPWRLAGLAGVLLLSGAACFAAGVAASALTHLSLGPLAPTGGLLLIGGWLCVAAGGVAAIAAKTPPREPW